VTCFLSAKNNVSGEFHVTTESKPHIIRQLPDVICKNGLTLLEGRLILTDQEISLINAQPIRDRVDPNSLGAEESSDGADKGADEIAKADERSKDENVQPAISIPLDSIESMTYETPRGRLSSSLLVKWLDDSGSFSRTRKSQFIQKGKSATQEERIVTWIQIIDEAKDARMTFHAKQADSEKEQEEEQSASDSERLESEILGVLDQKEWKGSFQIASELRDRYGPNYDFDQVETICKRLARKKLVDEDKIGGLFRKSKKGA
jgi:hypothetical protein